MRAFAWLLSAAMVTMVAEDFFNGAHRIHSGEFFPFRHLDFIPFYPPSVVGLEWVLTLIAAGLIASGRLRPGAWLGIAVTFAALTQRFSNHRSLLLILLVFLLFEAKSAQTLIRIQLLLVYGFSALNKITAGFLSGDSLANLFASRNIPDPIASAPIVQILSWAVVAAELLIPALFLTRPKLGIALQIATHTAFTLLMPGLASFGFLMIAMGALYLTQNNAENTHEH